MAGTEICPGTPTGVGCCIELKFSERSPSRSEIALVVGVALDNGN